MASRTIASPNPPERSSPWSKPNSLDDKRRRVPENDMSDLIACWQHQHDSKFQKERGALLAELQKQIAPLKKDRLEHHAIIHRLKFEEVIAGSAVGVQPSGCSNKNRSHSDRLKPELQPADAARSSRERAEVELAELQSRIAPLEKEINQITRQFWVAKEKVVAEKYDLSASRYRQVEQEEVFYEKAAVTLERMRQLEAAAENDVAALARMLAETSART